MFKVPERYRWENPAPGLESSSANGNNGVFVVPQRHGPTLQCIASDGNGWDHVSVSLPTRCPTWGEMCLIKNLFWGDDDVVVQYHPKKGEYINNHKYCLHLWRPQYADLLTPPKIMVGL